MKFKGDDPSIGKVGWRRWSILRHLSAERKTPPTPVSKATGRGLYLRINNDKNIIEISDKLKQRLSLLSCIDGVSFDSLLVQNHSWVALSPAEWPEELPVIKILNAQQQALSFTCCVVNEGADWLLLLADIHQSMVSLQQYENRLSLWNQAIEYSVRIQSARGEAGAVLSDWLESLSLRLDVTWAVVVVYDRHGQVSLQHYFNPELTLEPPNIRELYNQLELNLHHQSFSANGFWGELTWCVPYMDADGCQSWLCLGHSHNSLLYRWWKIKDLGKIFALVVEPALLKQRERQLVKTLDRYQSFELLSKGGWWEYYPDTDTMYFSRNLLKSLGVDESKDFVEMPARVWLDMIAPADRHELRCKLNTEGHLKHCFRFLVNDKHSWYQVEGVHTQDENKRYILGIALDVNDIQTVAWEAEKNQARMKGLVDSAPGIIYIQLYDQGMLTMSFYSGSLKNTLGWSLEDFVENSYTYYIHPDDRENYFAHVRHLLSSGSSGFQYRIRDINGQFHWVQDEARLIRDDKGMPVEVIGLCLDITQSKEDSERIYHSEERYRALVENSPAIIFRYTPDLEVTFANNMLYSALSLDTRDCDSINMQDFVVKEYYPELRKRVDDMYMEDACYTSEVTVRRHDGHLRWWVIYERGIFDEQGSLVEVQAVARDNTELHEARQHMLHSAKMATLGQMATGLAHEISQPLNVIHMAITNLVTKVDAGSVTDTYLVVKLGRIASQIARAEKIIDHMRIFGRQSDIKGRIFNPKIAVENALTLLEIKLRKDEIEVVREIQSLPNIVGHSDRLEQVLINLIVNASSAALERSRDVGGRPLIKIEGESDQRMVFLRVRDNGKGIPPEIMDRIFDPFFTTKPPGEGTGLGLSISYSIIKQMSGRLMVQSDHQGAVFTIELPVMSA